MAKIGKPYSEEKTRLSVGSPLPCDGLVECVTPLIVIMVLVTEALYNAEVSPSFYNIGVLSQIYATSSIPVHSAVFI